MLYLIGCGKYVKIGVSARPWERLAEFQTGNPEPLEMLAIGPGDHAFESELHRLFGEYRGIGEWFQDNGRIRAVATFMRETFPELQVQPRSVAEPSSEMRIIQVARRRVDIGNNTEIRSTWLEFRSKPYTKRDGTRSYYGRYRGWQKENGVWRKRYIEAAGIKLDENEYAEYKRTGILPTPPAPPAPEETA